MDKKEQEVVVNIDGYNETVREPIEMAFSRIELTSIQSNIFYRALTRMVIPEHLDPEKRYKVTFRRSDIPRVANTVDLITELEALQNIKMHPVLTGRLKGRESIVIIPKIGEYSNGEISVWIDGEFIQAILNLELTEGYSVFDIAELFKLTGAHAKRLLAMFSGYKNRKITIFKIDIPALKTILAVEDKYVNNHRAFFDQAIAHSVAQINEKTSLEVHASYHKKKGSTPAHIVFDVQRKDRNEGHILPQTPSVEPSSLDERQMKCYKLLTDWGLPPQKAFKCATTPDLMKFFFKWSHNSGVGAQVHTQALSRGEAVKKFYSALKAHNLFL